MIEKRDNYLIQMQQAKARFLTYDQQELIQRCRVEFDEDYLYTRLLSQPYRIHRRTGDMERFHAGTWVDGNSFHEVMTILDWLCDSRPHRFLTGRWVNLVTKGPCFHSNLQENDKDPNATLFDRYPEAFSSACQQLGGEQLPGADISYAIALLDDLRILVQLWHGDEEFSPRLRCLWDENALMYLRYETTWFATGLLMARIRERMRV